MTSSYINEMHDVICVNLFLPQVNEIPPQRKGVTSPLSTTWTAAIILRWRVLFSVFSFVSLFFHCPILFLIVYSQSVTLKYPALMYRLFPHHSLKMPGPLLVFHTFMITLSTFHHSNTFHLHTLSGTLFWYTYKSTNIARYMRHSISRQASLG